MPIQTLADHAWDNSNVQPEIHHAATQSDVSL
jgi:hypothetical protein